MMLLRRLGWLCLLLGCTLSAQAQWGLAVKNLNRPGTNVRLFLGYDGISEADKVFKAMVNFRLAGEGRVRLYKERILSISGNDTVFMDLKLPAGRYDVDVEIEDRKANSYQSLSLPEPFRVHRSREIAVSDIFIAPDRQWQQPFARPMLKSVIPYDQDQMYYCLELNAPGYEVLTLRAVLYQEAPAQNGSPTTAYQSLQQTNRVTYFDLPGPITFRDTLDLASLPGGEYMIQVLVYDDDDFLVDEKTWFVKGGDIKQRIFADLDNSIRMMRYLVPGEQLRQLLETRDAAVKKVEFLKIWEKLYDEEAEARMESYFETAYTANDRYEELQRPGWLTDRGRIFIQYGEPRVKSLQIQGKDYVRWTYARWALSFLFEKHNQSYHLVE